MTPQEYGKAVEGKAWFPTINFKTLSRSDGLTCWRPLTMATFDDLARIGNGPRFIGEQFSVDKDGKRL